MSFNSCLVDFVCVKTDPNYASAVKRITEIRPELHEKKTSNIPDNEYFQSQYAGALFFIMNSYEKCERVKFFKRPGDSGYVEGVTAITKECQLAQGRQLQISHLPIEDTVWSIDRVIDQTDTTDMMLVILDRCSLVVGLTVWDLSSSTTLSEHVCLALCTACLFPMVHRPRRPRYFSIRDKYLTSNCSPDIGGLGITFITGPDRTGGQRSHTAVTSTDTPPLFRECNVCHFRAKREMFHTCEGCGAMLYCTNACQEIDWGKDGQTTLYNHSKWCHRLNIYMEEEKQLVDLPFTFTAETTHPDFGVHQLEAFLRRIGLFGQGLWQWVCPVTSGLPVIQTHGTGFFEDHPNLFWVIRENASSTESLLENNNTQGSQSGNSSTNLDQSEDSFPQVDQKGDSETKVDHTEISYTKVDQSCAVGDKLQNPDIPIDQAGSTGTLLTDWASYYKHKGFSFDSPVAVLLQWPLTLYHILTSCLPQDYGCKLAEDRPVIVDILGVEQEVDLYPVFQELGCLLPGHDFVINLFGKNISKVVDRCVKVMGRVKVKVYRHLYHNYKCRWKPDLAIGFNAGIAAYPSWRDTIKKLKDDQIPAYFTDYCHYSADLGREVVREGCGLETSTPSMNPFRSPMRRVCEQHLLPWFSNAFIFHLIYSPIKQS